MLELTLLDTSYLAGLLSLSLVLPLLMNFRSTQPDRVRGICLRTIWTGQALLAFAGLAVLVSARIAPYAAAFGFVNCICCALALLWNFRDEQRCMRDERPHYTL